MARSLFAGRFLRSVLQNYNNKKNINNNDNDNNENNENNNKNNNYGDKRLILLMILVIRERGLFTIFDFVNNVTSFSAVVLNVNNQLVMITIIIIKHYMFARWININENEIKRKLMDKNTRTP